MKIIKYTNSSNDYDTYDGRYIKKDMFYTKCKYEAEKFSEWVAKMLCGYWNDSSRPYESYIIEDAPESDEEEEIDRLRRKVERLKKELEVADAAIYDLEKHLHWVKKL